MKFENVAGIDEAAGFRALDAFFVCLFVLFFGFLFWFSFCFCLVLFEFLFWFAFGFSFCLVFDFCLWSFGFFSAGGLEVVVSKQWFLLDVPMSTCLRQLEPPFLPSSRTFQQVLLGGA